MSVTRNASTTLNRRSDVEQPPILAVAADQHQSRGKPALARHRQRDRAKIEEIGRIGIAQEQRILAAEFIGLRDLGDGGCGNWRRR